MLNFENEGDKIAIIQGTKGKNIPILCIGNGARQEYKEIKLKEGESFQHVPNVNKERDILYITGQSGSGKSYYTAQYCLQYKAIYPKRNIYLFSALSEDKGSLDLVKGLKKVKLDDDFINDDDITIDELKESLVIFDDVDNLKKGLKNKIWTLMNSILQTGRHTKTSAIITYHLPTNSHDTRLILNECHSITIFVATMGGAKLKYLLDAYLGMDKKEIQKVKKMKSRWITIFKTYPKVILSQSEAFIPSMDD
jgi:hypothetical protein